MSDSELCCCLSVLLASVWPCFASMTHCPLWRIKGRESHIPRDLEALVPLNLWESWMHGGAGLMGMFELGLSEFFPIIICLLHPFLNCCCPWDR